MKDNKTKQPNSIIDAKEKSEKTALNLNKNKLKHHYHECIMHERGYSTLQEYLNFFK